jgi:hypothetical protein
MRRDQDKTKADGGNQRHMTAWRQIAGAKCAKRPTTIVVNGTQ